MSMNKAVPVPDGEVQSLHRRLSLFVAKIKRQIGTIWEYLRDGLSIGSAKSCQLVVQHLFEALARAMLSVRQPFLLLLDDLQWCDAETLAWLHYLLRFDPQARFLLVGTMRLEETMTEHLLMSLLLSLRREGVVTEIPLDALDASETASLAERLVGQKLDSHGRLLFSPTQQRPPDELTTVLVIIVHCVSSQVTLNRNTILFL